MTLQQLINKNRAGLEDKFEEMKHHVELARDHIDFLDNFNKINENFQYINGYIWALYVYGIITEEEHNGLFNELQEARSIKPKE